LCQPQVLPLVLRFAGSLDKNAKDVGTGIVGAPACGDVMKLQVRHIR
jgi:NifU-like protein involved in Fe-S cluster formation